MTPEEFHTKMLEIAGPLRHGEYVRRGARGGCEGAHGNADDLMITVMRELGFTKGMDVYDQMVKWYA